MALSAAERKRKQRERQAAERGPKVDPAYQYADVPFFQFAASHGSWGNVELMFDLMGIEPPEFLDDTGPAPYDPSGHDEVIEAYEGRLGSVGRAEIMIEHLVDAAIELADIVNDYKVKAVERRILELEEADLLTPEERKAAVVELGALQQMKDRLSKGVRRTLPEWSARGERA